MAARSYIRKVGTKGIYNESDEFMAGQSMMFSGPVEKIPAGWLLEDGSAISRTVYATLFSVIGVTYGAGDGVSTFNLPDSRGEIWRGLDLGAGRDPGRAMGSKQADAGRRIVGTVGAILRAANNGATGSLKGVAYGSTPPKQGVFGADSGDSMTLEFDSQLGLPSNTGPEFRMRNIPKIPIIKYS